MSVSRRTFSFWQWLLAARLPAVATRGIEARHSKWSPQFLPLNCGSRAERQAPVVMKADPSPQGAEVPPPEAFVTAMRRMTSQVAIVATGTAPDRSGMTATAICSLTAAPPQMLACLNAGSATAQAVLRNGRFFINLLGAGHSKLAHRFAGRDGTRGEARFDDLHWRVGQEGTPLLADALVSFECRLDQSIPSETHLILVGAVLRLEAAGEAAPLLYGDGRFGGWAKFGEGIE